MKNIPFKLYPNLIRDIKLLYRDPKAFLYSFTFPTDEYVHILPFDPKINVDGNNLVQKIHKTHPKLVVHFVGSASLGIAGHSDIDLLAECTPESFDKYIPALQKIFGAEFKRRPQFVEWHTTYKGSDVQFMLIDPKHRTFKDIMKVYYLFKSDKSLLEGYKKVKIECQGQSLREYKRRRMEFFNQIMLSH